MDCFLVKNGGGAALNFKVVGNPQPEAPSENTIWVNTDVPIGKWYFDVSQPDDLLEGDVWFSVGTSSPVRFNALRKNGIQVYPLKARQYINGAWVDKAAKSYQGGKWVDWWNGIALEPNNQYSAYTGGWAADARLAPWTANSNSFKAPTVSHGTSSISISLPKAVEQAGFTSNGYNGCYRTSQKVDLTGFDSLKFDFGSVSAPGGAVMVGCIDKLDVGLSGNAAAYAVVASSNTFSGGIKSLDVSAINGEYYIAIALCVYGNSTTPVTAAVKKVYLE